MRFTANWPEFVKCCELSRSRKKVETEKEYRENEHAKTKDEENLLSAKLLEVNARDQCASLALTSV
jgi:hypothetical protein